MSQKAKLQELLQSGPVRVEDAIRQGIRNPRQQVYLLRQDGLRIINCEKQKYRIVNNHPRSV